jgi:hypothetical protein
MTGDEGLGNRVQPPKPLLVRPCMYKKHIHCKILRKTSEHIQTLCRNGTPAPIPTLSLSLSPNFSLFSISMAKHQHPFSPSRSLSLSLSLSHSLCRNASTHSLCLAVSVSALARPLSLYAKTPALSLSLSLSLYGETPATQKTSLWKLGSEKRIVPIVDAVTYIFSKVSDLVYLQYKATMKLTSEN